MADRSPSNPSREGPTQLIYDQRRPALVTRSSTLRVIAGPDVGRQAALRLERLRVGSAPENDLVLSDPGVSRHHLEFQVHDLGYLLRDLQSTNGTFYRGARVREALLGVGAEIRLAGTVLRLERGEERTDPIGGREAFGELVGKSAAMQELFGVLAAVAPTEATVLLVGETGTGKEMVAEELHRQSPRSGRLFSVIDCGALPASLIESELFGHEKGAFTGATEQRIGVFERSRGGTVFLDEIGELPLALQTRLLRVLDRRTIRRVGGNIQHSVDVRLVAATNRDLTEAVKQGGFRQDLYYRLSVVKVVVPPLRKRREDIPLLARHFLRQIGNVADAETVLTPELLEVLASRRWPGNVRELRNVIERATIMIDGAAAPFESSDPGEPSAAPAPPRPRAGAEEASGPSAWLERAAPADFWGQSFKVARDRLVGEFERQYLWRLVQRYGSNISAIARDAGIDRHQVRRMLRRHGMYEG